ncbi:hypothetical protein M407DRAFT_5297 [Tulasnella calospora MUT 4182]|uniref:Uncharacterized protein n=1 Tax=Tulasnella calospora MUT 4182 TaxID=1051891 RepID=A0A0C3QSQ8_9AGAM|nr:hypothetical protein M407DRAFT_5297 [Tulasnella calospora MUT 4182]
MFSSTLVSLAAAALFFLPSALSAPIANPTVITDVVAVADVQVNLHGVFAGFTDGRAKAKTLIDDIAAIKVDATTVDTVVTKLEAVHEIYATVSAYSNGLLTYAGSVDVNAAVDATAFAEVGAGVAAEIGACLEVLLKLETEVDAAVWVKLHAAITEVELAMNCMYKSLDVIVVGFLVALVIKIKLLAITLVQVIANLKIECLVSILII